MSESAAMLAMREARGGLLLTHPFFGVLSLKIDLQEDSTVPTMCVNSKRLRFNPGFVLGLSNAERKGVIAHEVMHLALLHHARQGSKDPMLWNQAGDYAINANLIRDGFTLPQGALLDDRFKDKHAELIYRVLEGERKKPEPQKQESKSQNPGEEDQDGSGNGDSQDQDGSGDDDSQDQGNDTSQDDSGTGEPSQGQPDANNPCGTFEPAGPDDSADSADAEREWQQNVAEAIRAASSAGKLPAGIKRDMEDTLAPKAPWEDHLRRFAIDQIKTLNTWSKRNKRFPDINLPGKRNDGMGELVLLVDTSGSIDQRLLARFGVQIQAIALDLEPSEIHVVYCDTDVHCVESFMLGEEIKLNALGGGGTRFTPAFERIESEGWNPVAVIYFTDLECNDYPANEPSYPVLWAVYGGTKLTPPWGERIDLE